MPNRTSLEQRMLDAVRGLSPGEVISYSDVAARAGRPRAARAAGRLLAKADPNLPWWRVVYSDGRLPTCNVRFQKKKLKEEGVTLKGNKVVAAPLGRFES